MKKFILQLGRTPQFAIAGVFGVFASLQKLATYNAATDKSDGFAFWILVFALVFSASYVVLFVILRVFVKEDPSSLQVTEVKSGALGSSLKNIMLKSNKKL